MSLSSYDTYLISTFSFSTRNCFVPIFSSFFCFFLAVLYFFCFFLVPFPLFPYFFCVFRSSFCFFVSSSGIVPSFIFHPIYMCIARRVHCSYSECGKRETRVIWCMATYKGSTRCWNYLEGCWPCAGRLSAVNAIGTQLRDLINAGLTRWRLAVEIMDAVAESGRNPVNKHQIQPECVE